MFERFLFSIILLLLFFSAAKIYGVYHERQILRRPRWRMLPDKIRFDKPTLLYFWTPECSQCKPQEQQIEKAINGLRQSGKILDVQKYNALEEQKMAKEMRVMTVPTTVLLDSHGAITAWNAGLTQAQKLVQQFEIIQAQVK